MRLVPVLALIVLVGCGGASSSMVESGCLIGTSHVGQTCRGAPVYRASFDRDGDGIHDNEDLCPDRPAPDTTNGCPPHTPPPESPTD